MLVVPALLSRAVCRLAVSASDLVQTERERCVVLTVGEHRRCCLGTHVGLPAPPGLLQGMTVEEFKFIYFWEWGHRMWGRALGEGRSRGVQDDGWEAAGSGVAAWGGKAAPSHDNRMPAYLSTLALLIATA